MYAVRLTSADCDMRGMTQNVHGPLMAVLAGRVRYHDADAVELFREGAPIVGELADSGG